MKPSVALAVYLASLYIMFTIYAYVKEEIIKMLLEAGLSTQELIDVQNALEVLVDLIEYEEKKD